MEWRTEFAEGEIVILDELAEFAGKPVVTWEPGITLENPAITAYRIRRGWDEGLTAVGVLKSVVNAFAQLAGRKPEAAPKIDNSWTGRFGVFLDDPRSAEVTAIVVGVTGAVTEQELNNLEVLDALVGAARRLPQLRAIFLGDIIEDECWMSWIRQADFTPLLRAYPLLEVLGVRGDAVILGPIEHDCLKTLVVESGGLDASVVRGICNGRLPALEHLELWLGEENYGATTTLADLKPIFDGGLFPRLRYLGLRDSEISDGIAIAIADAPVLEQIRVLDLSLGTLGDTGGAALVESAGVRRLEKLDLHHHFLSEEMEQRFERLGIEVDVSEPVVAEDAGDGTSYRYVAVGE